MEARTLLLCFLSAVFVGAVLGGRGAYGSADAPVGSICRPKERLLECGCPKTCRDPVPECKGVCVPGCYCEEGEVRNATGHCVKLADCPPHKYPHLPLEDDCPDLEEFRLCEPCNRSCENPNPVCPAQCLRGCFCKDGLFRDTNGKCVKLEKCSKATRFNEIGYVPQPIPYRIMCGPLQRYKSCETCEKTCSNPKPSCPMSCKKGCFCDPGFVKAPSGDCVKLSDCPQAEVTLGGAHDPSVEDCASDEEYLSCGWCEPSCSDPAPICPVGVCTRGCLCRPPLLRHRSGHCVQEKDCLPHKCTEANEEYICRYGCEPRCDRPTCSVRPRRCALGCHCRLGYLRDIATGLCVASENCTKSDAVITIRN